MTQGPASRDHDAGLADCRVGVVCMKPRPTAVRGHTLNAYQTEVRESAEAITEVPIAWSRRWAPTLESVEHLRGMVPKHLHEAFFSTSGGETDWEAHAHGNFALGFQGQIPSIDALAAYFNGQILPSAVTSTTRDEYDGMWRAWITFCYCQQCLDKVFPTDNHTLRAFVVHLLLCGYSAASVAKHLAAILHRQRQFGGPHPLAFRQLGTWLKPLRKALSTPKPVLVRLHARHIRDMLQIIPDDLIQERDILMVAVGTVGAMRPSEVVGLDVCDWLVGHELGADNRPLGAAAYIKKQKNDQIRQGMLKRFAFGTEKQTCIPYRVGEYLKKTGLRNHPQCVKWTGRLENQASACETCGRLFRKMRRYTDGDVAIAMAFPHALGVDAPQAALTSALKRIGVPPMGFTAKAMRRGGLSTAKRAGVPAALRREQSGHKSCANKAYESPSDSEGDEMIGAGDLPACEPQGGWRAEHLYYFSRAFAL